MMTADECVKKAWQCLLAGDTAGRDRWIAVARSLMTGKMQNPLSPRLPPIHIGEAKHVPEKKG
jgi:hypothetical protein